MMIKKNPKKQSKLFFNRSQKYYTSNNGYTFEQNEVLLDKPI